MHQYLLRTIAVVLLLSCHADAFARSASELSVTQAWARATPATIKIGAAYVTLSAAEGKSDQLIGASSPEAGRVEIHTHMMSGGTMSMAKIDSIDVPAGGMVTFEPGGHHFMLIDLKKQLKEGETLNLVLNFAKAGAVNVTATIVPAWSLGPNKSPGASTQGGEPHHKHH